MKNRKWFLLCISTVFLILSLLPLSACSPDTLSEAEMEGFLKEASNVLSRAETVNNIWFTEEGIPEKTGGYRYGNYSEIDNSALQKMGFQSFSAIKEETALLFDNATYAEINRILEITPKRYIVHRTVEEKEEDEVETVMRYIDKSGNYFYESDVITFHLDTLRFDQQTVRNGRNIVTVTVDVTVTNEDGQKQRMPAVDFDFAKEGEAWKLTELVYMTYTGTES